ncbi:TPA: histone deacetylase family protein [Candidatus Poribacteria bacterium]|nr:histone deacetylase family protein [Candidatus Poribacteria bacterium]
MKFIYTESHKCHAPQYEFNRDRMTTYSESPARAEIILWALQKSDFTEITTPRQYPLAFIRAVHDSDYIYYLENIYSVWITEGEPEAGVIPHTFALRTMSKRPEKLVNQTGYYCFDAQTPIVQGTYEGALFSAYCALTGADMLLEGESAVYALCRPPGHHAGRGIYGGYCYLNNAAIAAKHLSQEARVSILDIDYHHGNGTQEIFYDSSRVLFVSIHANPNRAYPFFSGFADEHGVGAGRGFNYNFPLEEHVDERQYIKVLEHAMDIIQQFDPGFLVVSFGVDTFRDDPLGDFDLSLESFSHIGKRIAQMRRPTLLVQEGGYNLQALGEGVVNMLWGFCYDFSVSA